MKNFTLYCFLTSLLIVCLSCKGPKGDVGPTGTPGPESKLHEGDLVGIVQLFDEQGIPLYNNSEVTVRIAQYPLITTTDISGKWMFTSLKPGTYTIVFEKTGFGTFKQIKYEFAGGDAIFSSAISLYQIPTYSMNGSGPLKAFPFQDTIAEYVKSIPRTTNGTVRSIRWFLIEKQNNYDSAFFATGTPYIFTSISSSTVDSFAVHIPGSWLRSRGVKSGTIMDLIACPTSSSNCYFDTLTGLFVYPFIARPQSYSSGYTMP